MHGDAAGARSRRRARRPHERAGRGARRARRRRDRRRSAAARERRACSASRTGARGLADRQRPPLVRPAAARQPLAALLGSDAHWVFDRGALTGHRPERGQYLTVVSSGVPELLELRGRELVERIAGQLTERLGEAELLWSRVSREPYATVALRPGVGRPGVETSPPERRPRRHVDRHRLAGDDGERGPQRPPGGSAHLEQRFTRRVTLDDGRHRRADAPRPGDRPRYAPPARAAAAGRHLGRRARVERDDDRAAPLLAPLPRPAHARARPPDRERAARAEARRRDVVDLVRGAARPLHLDRGVRRVPPRRRRPGRRERCDFIQRAGRHPEEPRSSRSASWRCSASGRGSGWRRSRPSSSCCRRARPSRSTTSPAGRGRRSLPLSVVAVAAARAAGGRRPARDRRAAGRDAAAARGRARCAAARIATAERWIRERQEADGSWGGIQPPWVWSIIALAALGNGLDDPALRQGGRGLAAGSWSTTATGSGPRRASRRSGTPGSPCSRCAPAVSPPTTRSSSAPASTSSREEVHVKGDWAIRRPDLAPGGWAFEFENDLYPDVDDTAVLALALRGSASARRRVARGLDWLVGMQSRGRRLGRVRRRQPRRLALQDPVLRLRQGDRPAERRRHRARAGGARARAGQTTQRERGLDWLLREQEEDGSWFGRWGVNHLYGTGAALPGARGLRHPARPPGHATAVAWLDSVQQERRLRRGHPLLRRSSVAWPRRVHDGLADRLGAPCLRRRRKR